MELALFLLVIPAIPLIFWLILRHQERVGAAWRQAAEGLGLSHTADGMFGKREIQGELEGHRISIRKHVQRSGRSSKTFTRYQVSYPRPLELDLRLKRQGVFQGVARFFGAQDIQVGDPAFDPDVVVQGADPAQVLEFLTPARRLRVLRLMNALEGCEITGSSITWSNTGLETDAERLAGYVRRMVRLASSLCGDSRTDGSLDRALEARREGRLGEALEIVREDTGEGAPDPESRMVEGEILYAGQRYEEAGETFRQGARDASGDEELEAWADHAEDRGRRPVEASPAAHEPDDPKPSTDQAAEASAGDEGRQEQPSAPSPSVGPDSRALCEELFDPDLLSLEATRVFEERYQGRRVRWTGTLRQVEEFTFDVVLGDAPGTKAILDLHEVRAGTLSRMVRAVLRLPLASEPFLKDRIGERITFEGRLLSCDAFLHNLFLSEGSVIDSA